MTQVLMETYHIVPSSLFYIWNTQKVVQAIVGVNLEYGRKL